MKKKVLEVKNLEIEFHTYAGVAKAIRDVSFDLYDREILAIVGESGSGKSVTTQAILQLLPTPPAKILNGEVLYKGKDLLTLNKKQLQKIQGKEIAVIFQDAMTALNPLIKIGTQITETIIAHSFYDEVEATYIVEELFDKEVTDEAIKNWLFRYFYTEQEDYLTFVKEHLEDKTELVKWSIENSKISKERANQIAVELLEMVKIPNPEQRLKQYVYQFSGGMRQRAMIAIAMACRPRVLIADEPTTALDVTIKADIMDLMIDLVKRLSSSIILITHDLGVVAAHADRIIVMYAGKIVEQGTADEVFYEHKHPYTEGLIKAIPRLDSDRTVELETIDGTPPNIMQLNTGCAFYKRCSKCMKVCKDFNPETTTLSQFHSLSCWLTDKRAGGNE